MKKAIIVTGKHWAGKSKTINDHLKPLFGISLKSYTFWLKGKRGFIISQSIEESGRPIEILIKKCSGFDIVIVATRVSTDNATKHELVNNKLEKNGFKTKTFIITKHEKENYYTGMAKEIFDSL